MSIQKLIDMRNQLQQSRDLMHNELKKIETLYFELEKIAQSAEGAVDYFDEALAALDDGIKSLREAYDA